MKTKEPLYNLEVTPLARWVAAGFDAAFSFPGGFSNLYVGLLNQGLLLALPVTISVCVGTSAALWLVCRILTAGINRMRRPKYYVRERIRRRELRAQRRKIAPRRTLNPCPSPELLAELWSVRKRSETDMVRLGSALLDLDAYVDNRLQFDDNGKICGRNPGVKGWLFEHCPDIWAHYKTAMRYKQLAVKLRQATGLTDPYPAETALGGDGANGNVSDETMWRNEIEDEPQENDVMRLRGGKDNIGGSDEPEVSELPVGGDVRLCSGTDFGDNPGAAGVGGSAGNGGSADSVGPAGSVESAGAGGPEGGDVAPGWEFVRGAGPGNNLPLARAVARAVLDGGGGMAGLMARLNQRLDENFGLKAIGPAG
ncbi:MAG: hypothetical protein IJU44_06425 [Kiritimatiellae bacterium]|nr:hypothetical protein [Kiritimatiellia bacterium]